MKGFSEQIESFMACSFEMLISFCDELYEDITVEPVPDLGDAPDELLTVSFLKTMANRHDYHQKRIEREGRG